MIATRGRAMASVPAAPNQGNGWQEALSAPSRTVPKGNNKRRFGGKRPSARAA